MRVLIVDDSRVMRQIVRRALRQAGFDSFEVEEAENGKEALDIALNNPPGLILSDWNMPEMTGIECLIAMRAAGSTVPFGFVTSEGSAEMRSQAKDAGALFLVAKPFTEVTMREALAGVAA